MSQQREIPARVRGLEATISLAIDRAEQSSWRARFTSSTVQSQADGEIPDRTMRRALNDARELGWIEKHRQEWVPGDRAEAVAGVDDN